MKTWKKVVIGMFAVMVGLCLVLVIGGTMIDPKIELSTERQLKSAPVALFRFLDNAQGLQNWWSPPDAPAGMQKMQVKKKSGPDQGAGLVVTFESDGTVMETWTVKNVEPPTRVVYDVDFAGALTVERTLTLTPDGTGTRVSWRETGSLTSPLSRWMKVMMPPESIIKNFQGALDLLDTAAMIAP